MSESRLIRLFVAGSFVDPDSATDSAADRMVLGHHPDSVRKYALPKFDSAAPASQLKDRLTRKFDTSRAVDIDDLHFDLFAFFQDVTNGANTLVRDFRDMEQPLAIR